MDPHLYVVLRHRRAAIQTYTNIWLDDDRIHIIETPEEVGQLCDEARKKDERVFVHRCRWEEFDAVISCSAKVDSIQPGHGGSVFVTFSDQVALSAKPPLIPRQGQNYYFA